ncbi:GGDEF domain-containing protein [Burkholderia glumae]|uniref:GGDEF domain-containing protein n=1 Tax=Burkholderia glumae TaxID=337 RepID=UPI0003AAF3B6|nr:GGDEF domain-containing protein [Burkholderia glumae]MCM2491129.1 GGDEF domain-containing protein [Burkholderia glumae]MCM2542122.1 GGDEF domain-containing protein [Burkholderia glumae]
MHVDLLTFYFLAIGTLLASAGMTFWEHRTHPNRGRALRTFAAGYATLAIGCAVVLVRGRLPGAWGSALANLVMVSGYLLILDGVAILNGRCRRGASLGLVALLALAWVVAGTRGQQTMWLYLSAIPIALASAMTTRELLRNAALRVLPAWRIAVAVTGLHALLYLARALALPWLAREFGPSFVLAASQLTMYEGVLYSVVLPMTLLRLVREETHGELLRESRTDYLTRLGSRRWFFEEGERVVAAAAGRQALAVLAFDLDHFKRINDRHGHKTGDEVLKTFAEVVRGELGEGAIVARLGGEEFAALLAGADAQRAAALGRAVARRFAETIDSRGDGLEIRATVSIGLAADEAGTPPLPPPLPPALLLADLLASADGALYRAKSLGGNRLERA